MNYLFINGKFPQYSQTFVHDQIKAIKSNGFHVEVYARSLAPFRFEESTPECADSLIYGKPTNYRLLQRVFFRFFRHPVRSVKLLILFWSGKITYSTLMLGLQIKRVPDVAVTHFGSNFENGTELREHLFPNMKNVVVFHGHDVSSYIKKNGWDNYKKAAPFIDSAICVNKVWAEAIKSHTAIGDVRTVYLGTSIAPLKRRPNGDLSSISIVFVGRFVEKKGFDILYRAVKNLRVSMKCSFRVHCVGDGLDLNLVKKRSQSEGLDETFIFYGSSQKSFVQQLMRECDLFVAPSRVAKNGDAEGIPVVLMEAMMAGIPVISTEHSGIPELVTHLETGLLVPENDVHQLEKAIEFAVRNPAAMKVICDKAYKHVQVAHNEVTQVQKFTAALREIV